MNGKDKCKLLNDVRHRIAEKNNIEFDFEDCDIEGDCSGTCPKCESEVEYLERELEKKQEKGEKIDLEGIFTLKERKPTELKAGDVFEVFGMPRHPYCEAIAIHFRTLEDDDSSDCEEEESLAYSIYKTGSNTTTFACDEEDCEFPSEGENGEI